MDVVQGTRPAGSFRKSTWELYNTTVAIQDRRRYRKNVINALLPRNTGSLPTQMNSRRRYEEGRTGKVPQD